MANDKTIGNMLNDKTKSMFSDVGSILYLHPDEIIANKLNKAEISDITEMISSIAEKGIQTPLTAYESEGHYVLLSGERRWTAAKEMKLEELPVLIWPKPEEEWIEILEIELANSHREEDIKMRILNLESSWNAMPAEARPTGITKRQWIANHLTQKMSDRNVGRYLYGELGDDSPKAESTKKEKDYLKSIMNSAKSLIKNVDKIESENTLYSITSYKTDDEITEFEDILDNLSGVIMNLKIVVEGKKKERNKICQ